MGDGVRQYKALMRKNFINWKRSPKSAIFEIFCSSAVFLVLVWIRTLVDVTEIDVSNLAAARHAVLPTLWYQHGQWTPLGN